MAILLAAPSPTASESSAIRPNIASGSGLISGRWVLTAKFPASSGPLRGYRKKAVDGFLVECANGIDWLHGLLIGADNEIVRLNGLLAAAQNEIDRLNPASTGGRELAPPAATMQAGIRSISRAAAAKERKRPARRRKRPRIRAAGQRTVSPF